MKLFLETKEFHQNDKKYTFEIDFLTSSEHLQELHL
jgi:hypothetical protein